MIGFTGAHSYAFLQKHRGSSLTFMGKQETLETASGKYRTSFGNGSEPIILDRRPAGKPACRQSASCFSTTDASDVHPYSRVRLRSPGCQWNRLPKELGDDSTQVSWGTFQRWVGTGRRCDRHVGSPGGGVRRAWHGVDWEWQAADGAMGKGHALSIHKGTCDWAQPCYGPWQGWYQAQVSLWMERACPLSIAPSAGSQTCTPCQAVRTPRPWLRTLWSQRRTVPTDR